MSVNLDWGNLGFSYMKLPYRYLAYYKNGKWEKGELDSVPAVLCHPSYAVRRNTGGVRRKICLFAHSVHAAADTCRA